MAWNLSYVSLLSCEHEESVKPPLRIGIVQLMYGRCFIVFFIPVRPSVVVEAIYYSLYERQILH